MSRATAVNATISVEGVCKLAHYTGEAANSRSVRKGRLEGLASEGGLTGSASFFFLVSTSFMWLSVLFFWEYLAAFLLPLGFLRFFALHKISSFFSKFFIGILWNWSGSVFL